jgi:hypothetical protein
MKLKIIIALLLLTLTSCGNEKVIKVKANLSAFGVESDFAPTIDAEIDFVKATGMAHRSYYDPKFKNSEYTFSMAEINKVRDLLESTKLSALKPKYSVGNMSDQPTSTVTIYTNKDTYTIEDYGLSAKDLSEIYTILYKYEY